MFYSFCQSVKQLRAPCSLALLGFSFSRCCSSIRSTTTPHPFSVDIIISSCFCQYLGIFSNQCKHVFRSKNFVGENAYLYLKCYEMLPSPNIAFSVPAVLAVAAFMCSALFTFFCESVQVEPTTDTTLPTIEFGLYTTKRYYIQEFPAGTYRVKTGCFYFESDISFDSKWKAARALGATTVAVGGLAIIVSIFAPMCYRVSDSAWKGLAGLYMVILPLFQGLTFLMLQSEFCSGNGLFADFAEVEGEYGSCQWNGGSAANVCGIILWFLAGAAMLFSGTPARKSPGPAETQEVTYEQSQDPNGTVTVTETNVVKGTAVADADTEEQPGA